MATTMADIAFPMPETDGIYSVFAGEMLGCLHPWRSPNSWDVNGSNCSGMVEYQAVCRPKTGSMTATNRATACHVFAIFSPDHLILSSLTKPTKTNPPSLPLSP